MSVLIQGLKMPQGESCVTVRIWGDGKVIGVHNDSLVKHAIEVSPHGRLIDADALLADDNRKYDTYRGSNGRDPLLDDARHRAIQWTIEDAPTIIPADDPKLSATIKCGGAVTCAVAYSEEVYGKYTDTAGNLHWTGTKSGEHILKAEEGE